MISLLCWPVNGAIDIFAISDIIARVEKNPKPPRQILLRVDASLDALIEDVHHTLRFKTQADALREMLKAGGEALLKKSRGKNS